MQDQAERVDVAAGVHAARVGEQLLRAHVLQRPDEIADRGGERPRAVGTLRFRRPRDAEVDHARRSGRVHEKVARLDVAVDHAAFVCVRESAARVPQEPHAAADVEPRLASEPRDRSRILHELEHEVRHRARRPVMRAEGVELGDVGMAQACQQPRLAREAIVRRGRCVGHADKLDRHPPARSELASRMDAPHAPLADEALDHDTADDVTRLHR